MPNPIMIYSDDELNTSTSTEIPYALTGICGGCDLTGRVWVFGYFLDSTNQFGAGAITWIVYTYSDDNGNTWADLTEVTHSIVNTAAIDCMVSDVTGTVWIFYMDNNNSKAYGKSFDNGSTWTFGTIV